MTRSDRAYLNRTKRILAEAASLREVLDALAVKPKKKGRK